MLVDCLNYLNLNYLNLNNNCVNLVLFYFNICSILKKLDKFLNFLGSFVLDFFVIGIIEIWLDNFSYLLDIQGYSFIYNLRVDRDGGGVGFYFVEYLKFKNCMDLIFVNDCVELLFVEVIRLMEKNIVIGVIYRLLDRNLNEFIGELDQLLSCIFKENKFVYLLVDWNINLFCYLNYYVMGEFLELMYLKIFFLFIM